MAPMVTAAALLLFLQSVAATTFTVKEGEKIQDALDKCQPGDTVAIEEGDYWEDIKTKVDGTASAPITIRGKSGTERSKVVLRGDGEWRMLHVAHDYYIIQDFTIDGKAGRAGDSADEDEYKAAYRNKLLYVLAERKYTERSGGYDSAVDGLEVKDMTLKNAGGECLRLKYFVTNAKIHGNEILDCGIHDFRYDQGGKTGEGVYVGTAMNQWNNDGMPTNGVDICANNHVYDNYIKTKGNEGVQVKEGAVDTIIEDNEIYMQRDENSGGIDSRGDRSIIRRNKVEDTHGACIRLGGEKDGGKQYGVDNHVYQNTLRDCDYAGIKIEEADQGVICENSIALPSGASSSYKLTRGDGSAGFQDPTMECSSYPGEGSSSPSETPPMPTPPAPTPPTPAVTESTPAPATSTPSTPTAPLSSANTIGCFEDKKGSRVMNLGYTDSEGMTIEACALYCKEDGKKYSGTQYGEECWCSNSSSFDKHGSSTKCDIACPGDDNEYCGGTWAILVAETSEFTSPSPTSTSTPTPGATIGCFKDRRSSRVMNYGFKSSEGMTNELCGLYCNENGKKYSGTQYGEECWCSNSSSYDEHGSSKYCNFPCPGDSDETCGGGWAMMVSESSSYGGGGDSDDESADDVVNGYLGCFKDVEDKRILDDAYWLTSTSMTLQTCINFCDEKGEDYAALEYGNECWCGSSDNYDRHGKSTSCTTPCNGNSSQKCGGTWAASIFKVEGR
ncbi:unnamed protein product [Scytosiphon promiscuus]